MISISNNNSAQGLLDINIYNQVQNSKVESLSKNHIHDNSSISLDSEAQELMTLVGNGIQENNNNAASIHQGLDYSRVMQLLEGL